MSIIPENLYDGDDPERIDEILLGMAYRLGREAGKSDDEIAESLKPEPSTPSVTVQAYELGRRSGLSESASRMIAHAGQEYWRGYADGVEAAFAAMDARTAAGVAEDWSSAVNARRAPRPLVAQARGPRTMQARARRLAVARRVAS